MNALYAFCNAAVPGNLGRGAWIVKARPAATSQKPYSVHNLHGFVQNAMVPGLKPGHRQGGATCP